ncbi:MAG: hypothetical protein V1726_01445 [Methanobacteriota archaeon]
MTDEKSMPLFSSIALEDPIIESNIVRTEVLLKDNDGQEHRFQLMNKYEHPLNSKHLPVLRLAFCMPLLNYGLFSEQFQLRFPLSEADVSLLNDLNMIFSRDIFVNKIAKGTNPYILPEYFPKEDKITQGDGDAKATITPTSIHADTPLHTSMNPMRCGVLSSGGKDSLLTYGLLKELGAQVYPLYMNESGGHWKTALSAYRYHTQNDPNTQRVWTNVDRFYTFMLDHLHLIRSDHRKKWEDIYPLRLCIFPFYVFSLLPLFVDQQIGNLLIGSEFDDFRTEIQFKGIKHYYGLYDQHQDYDAQMNRWYHQRIPGLHQWSALRNISGLVDQRILVQRYPHLARHQRSCHSCHIKNGNVYPCGTCLKCLGVLLFLLANKADPSIMNYRKKDVDFFYKKITTSPISLDTDEKTHSFFLLEDTHISCGFSYIDHVEKIHIDPATCNPQFYPKQFRENLLKILEEYTTGYCTLENGKWVSTEKWQEKTANLIP